MKRRLVAFGIFPASWILALAVWQPGKLDPFTALFQLAAIVVLGLLGGYVSIWLLRPGPSGWPRSWRVSAMVVACLLLPPVVLVGSWERVSAASREPNPIGDTSDRNFGDFCNTEELAVRQNGNGLEAASREAICDFGFGVDGIDDYVFVRQAGEKNSRENIALHFQVINEDTPPPILRWVSTDHLEISFAGDVSPIEKQLAAVNGVHITYNHKQHYAALVGWGNPTLFIDPNKDTMASMTFDLLPLPDRAPPTPFAPTGDYSAFHCDGELKQISEPARAGLEALRLRIEKSHATLGAYPQALEPTVIQGVAYASETTDAKLVPSNRVPGLRVIYHRTPNAYALELRFPDLQPNSNSKSYTGHYDSNPGEAFLTCASVHLGSRDEIVRAGGYIGGNMSARPAILFTPAIGLYMYSD